jgi:hypothetical protein
MMMTNKRSVQAMLSMCVLSAAICAGMGIVSPKLAAQAPQATAQIQEWNPAKLGDVLLKDPIWVYNNWSSYDELSDNIPLTETLAMKELGEIVRLKKLGVHFDYYMMDAFWFDPDGGYRKWRKPNWPNGPDRWIAECQKNGLKPGMWFGTNELVKINAAPQWKDSLTVKGGSMSFSDGGFLPDFMDVLQYWHDRGMRMFKFDFVDFDAATSTVEKGFSKQEIRERNQTALRDALRKFRAKNPDVVLVAFNGFGGDLESTAGPFPFRNHIDLRWLEVFDSIYSGDPRPSDVPETNFWRSMDIYGDHMVRRYQQSGIPIERIDSTAMMVGNTGTIYYRKTNAWKGMLWGIVSRGSWVNTVHGNLEYLDTEKAAWFARLQRMYEKLQAEGRTKTFGGIPGKVEPYGFGSVDTVGAVYTVLNPAQSMQQIELPLLTRVQGPLGKGRIIFRDAGFVPRLRDNRITLGPGQMAAVGFGRYTEDAFAFGVQEDVLIPKTIGPVSAKFEAKPGNVIEAVIQPPAKGDLRIVFQQLDEGGDVMRSWPGGPPNGKSIGTVLKIAAEQDGKALPIHVDYDRMIWSGLSWGAGEIWRKDFSSGAPITVRCSSAEKDPVKLEGKVYVVTYGSAVKHEAGNKGTEKVTE